MTDKLAGLYEGLPGEAGRVGESLAVRLRCRISHGTTLRVGEQVNPTTQLRPLIHTSGRVVQECRTMADYWAAVSAPRRFRLKPRQESGACVSGALPRSYPIGLRYVAIHEASAA